MRHRHAWKIAMIERKIAMIEHVLQVISPHFLSLFDRADPSIQSLEEFLLRDTARLADKWNLSYEEVSRLKTGVSNYLLFHSPEPKLWKDLLEVVPSSIAEQRCIESGIAEFDGMFSGGLPIGLVTGIIGDTNAGKTRICLNLALHAALQQKKILYICTNNHLNIRTLHSRLVTVMSNVDPYQSMSPEMRNQMVLEVLSKVVVEYVFCPWLLSDLLTHLPSKFDLIIIDCLSSLFSSYDLDSAEKYPSSTSTNNPASAPPNISNPHPLACSLQLLIKSLKTTFFLTLYPESYKWTEVLDVAVELSLRIIPNQGGDGLEKKYFTHAQVKTRPPYFKNYPMQSLLSLDL